MIFVSRLYEFLVETKTKIDEINSIKLVVDDSEITNSLDGHKTSENMILMGVVPAYDTAPSDDDALKHNVYLMFLILTKVDYSSLKGDGKIQMWDSTQRVMKKFEELLIQEKFSDSGKCPEFQDLVLNSIKIEPVWKLAGTNGWILTCTLEK